MHERHLVVTRSARFAVLGDEIARPAEVWFVLHGYGQLAARFLRAFEPLADGSRRIYAPEALNRYYLEERAGGHGPGSKVGATWMTREDRLTDIADYVRYLDTLYRHVFAEVARDATRVVTLGFSQGAATAARWVALGAARSDQLVLWGSGTPPDLDVGAALQGRTPPPVSLVYGRGDAWFDERAALVEAERLRGQGLDPTLLGFDGGHVLDGDALRELAPSL